MTAKLTRATTVASEAEVLAVFASEGLRSTRWTSAAHEVFAVHSHAYDKTLFCLRGSITFSGLDSGERFELRTGDRLDIEAGTRHAAVVGAEGVTCIEAARA